MAAGAPEKSALAGLTAHIGDDAGQQKIKEKSPVKANFDVAAPSPGLCVSFHFSSPPSKNDK